MIFGRVLNVNIYSCKHKYLTQDKLVYFAGTTSCISWDIRYLCFKCIKSYDIIDIYFGALWGTQKHIYDYDIRRFYEYNMRR